ncbi:ATP-binding protein [Halomicroarcula sp. F13]|uniref:histidine kinase n=1 Tax=Haloarcula rubra TaxID=2487747 RepID=A0AAW4PQJ8_9EURY|nr:ATP-binding protein [Halomicroarcula rubra]MBX0322944.1 ATP-binding protein [Halomicroarcula rubra]
MERRGVYRAAPWLLAGLGVSLYAIAAVWHLAVETTNLATLSGPVVSFALDGVVPLTLVYGSYRLVRADLPMERIWTVFLWSLAGCLLFSVVIGLSIFIRQTEGRIVAEPVFIMLLAADTGAVAGAVAGYFAARARRDADRAARATHTLTFVNDLLRHDITNGLTVVDGRAAMLAADAEDESRRTAARAIREQVEEMSQLVDNAGAVAATLSSGPTVQQRDLVGVVEGVVERTRTTYDATISLDTPDRATVCANEAIRPVVKNLVENAVEHNDDHPTVDVTVERGDETVRLHVVDDGPGIPEGERESIFAPRAGDTHGGGLHLVETLVERFDGDIWVADEGEGAHFVVELPRPA